MVDPAKLRPAPIIEATYALDAYLKSVTPKATLPVSVWKPHVRVTVAAFLNALLADDEAMDAGVLTMDGEPLPVTRRERANLRAAFVAAVQEDER